MKKYILKPGEKGINALHVREMTSRPLKPDEVCVRVQAVSLNYRDLINVNRGVKQELIPLSDGAGEVEEVGSEGRVWKRVIESWDFSFPSGKVAISMLLNSQQPEAEHPPTACWPSMFMGLKTVS